MSKPTYDSIYEYPVKEFKKVLEDDYSDRIIFSGKFGSGKTSFLKNFFSDRCQTDILKEIKYDVYNILPVNYSISSNEDIIRYIKYDIIIQFLQKGKVFTNIDWGFMNDLPAFVKTHLYEVSGTILHMIPKVGKDLAEMLKKIKELNDTFKAFSKQAHPSEGDAMIDYLAALEKKEGSIYENDVITKIIAGVLEKETKNSILIVDDLDRLDPEHVFRILNVFAAHFKDELETALKNKFNFNKIIIVCDVNNLRSIFAHKYGKGADFNGYIDKFYTSGIYYFDNKESVSAIVGEVMSSLGHDFQNPNVFNVFYRRSQFVERMVTLLLNAGYIGLRGIMNVYEKKVPPNTAEVAFRQEQGAYPIHSFPIIVQLKILVHFAGDYTNLIRIFEDCAERDIYLTGFKGYFGELVFIQSLEHFSLKEDNTFFEYHQQMLNVVHHKGDQYEIRDVKLYHTVKSEDGTETFQRSEELIIRRKMFWTALIETVTLLHNLGVLDK